ncbi:hypothetical protein FOZ63_027094 [Perkinsus olseni]|uniref:Uncharacterized protein n=1 Tax=Perkinsus olseni TaxID=32597 RepID=A0A7J6Q8A5_PEROL|nr:hypothetical protein FOZ63_027094 [Perkinsus olseni]
MFPTVQLQATQHLSEASYVPRSPFFPGPQPLPQLQQPSTGASVRSLTPTGIRLTNDPRQLFHAGSSTIRSFTPPPVRLGAQPVVLRQVSQPLPAPDGREKAGARTEPELSGSQVEKSARSTQKPKSRIVRPPSIDEELNTAPDVQANGHLLEILIATKKRMIGRSLPIKRILREFQEATAAARHRQSSACPAAGTDLPESTIEQKQIADLKARNERLSKELVGMGGWRSAFEELRHMKSRSLLLEKEVRSARHRIQQLEDAKLAQRARSRSLTTRVIDELGTEGQDVHQMLMQQVENAENLLASTTASFSGEAGASSMVGEEPSLVLVGLNHSDDWLQRLGIAVSCPTPDRAPAFVCRSPSRDDTLLLGLLEGGLESLDAKLAMSKIIGSLNSEPATSLRESPEDVLQEALAAAEDYLSLTLVLLLYGMADEASSSSERWMFVGHVGSGRPVLAYRKGSPEEGAFAVTCLSKDHGSNAVQGYQLRPGVDVMLMLTSNAVGRHMTNKQIALHVLREGLSAVERITASASAEGPASMVAMDLTMSE